ncbi:16S rRNA (cytidine(1402)-2'-O)-methyltransferase [bacterium]|nr:16S rRNA (cytidine(1402)-2'-O)-methyltransferase [bacterium]
MDKGRLYVVATPIGNLKDMTFRAIEILKEVAFILAEDTRETKKLLNEYSIHTQLVSYRDQNHICMIEKVVEKLDMGLDLALVSDCGTPLISDPGYKLVRDLRLKGYEVVSIPGPSALTSAMSVSGLPTDIFTFLGFLPKSEGKRKKLLTKYFALENTLVIYESPNRLFKLLRLLQVIDSTSLVTAIRDISKKRERAYFGSVSEVMSSLREDGLEETPHGEWVVVVSRKN